MNIRDAKRLSKVFADFPIDAGRDLRRIEGGQEGSPARNRAVGMISAILFYHMDLFKTLISEENWKSILEKYLDWQVILGTTTDILLILFVAWMVSLAFGSFMRTFRSQLEKRSKKANEDTTEASKRVETITRLLRQVFRIGLWTVVGLVVLKELGVDIAPVIAGAGILGLAVGFGAQNLVRDVISGFFIILENQIRVGDVAEVNGKGGLVEDINFRTTILRDLSGTVHIFPNGIIDTLSNLTKDWSGYVFDLGVAYKEDTDQVVGIIRGVAEELQSDPEIGSMIVEPIEIFGVDQFDDSAVIIKGRIKTTPIKQWTVGREFLRRIKYAFDRNDIEIPFPHISVYTGEQTQPFELQLLEGEKQRIEQASPTATNRDAHTDAQSREDAGE